MKRKTLAWLDDWGGIGYELLTLLDELIGKYVKKDSFTFVEIGVFSGVVALWLLESYPGVAYIGIDPYIPGRCGRGGDMKSARKVAYERIDGYNARIIEEPSLDAVKAFANDSVDIVFIDGSHLHDDVLNDMIAWFPKAKFMCGHDYDTVKKALGEFCNKFGVRYKTGRSSGWWIERN